MPLLEFNPPYQRQLQAFERAQANLRQAIARAQSRCKHLDIGECDYESLSLGGCNRPIRCCWQCGMTEEGWGSGYQVLKGEAIRVDRSLIYRTREGLIIDEDLKTPLIRRQATVQDLVAAWLENRLGAYRRS